jgi:hypothetical protein
MSRNLLILIPLLFLSAGCDVFRTRDAETPDSGRSTCEDPRQPGDVLDHLSCALFERSGVEYLRSFDSRGFTFFADDLALSRDASLAGWDYAAESAHVTSLLSPGTLPRDSALFVLFTARAESVLGDSATITTHYELTAGLALSGAPRRMAGTAEFGLVMGSEGYWQIYSLRDIRGGEESTWSDLRSLVR